MLVNERQFQILTWLDQKGTLSVSEICQRFNISNMTAWRDLKTLERKNKLTRVRGGVSRKGISSDSLHELGFQDKRAIRRAEKEAIARYAAEHYVTLGDIIILEGGTTVAMMVPLLRKNHLTILTNGLLTLNEAVSLIPNITVISSGGILREPSLTFVGPHAEAFFHEFHANTFFVGASGLSLKDGITDINTLEIQVKRAMKRSADKVVLLLDSSKFGCRSLLPIIPFSDVDVLVTDCQADPEMITELKQVIPEVVQV